MKVTARIDPNKKRVIVHYPDENGGFDKDFGTVMLKDVEWGAGMVRGNIVETFEAIVPNRHITKRAYFNRNKVARYVDKTTGKVLTDTAGAYLVGSSVLYVEKV